MTGGGLLGIIAACWMTRKEDDVGTAFKVMVAVLAAAVFGGTAWVHFYHPGEELNFLLITVKETGLSTDLVGGMLLFKVALNLSRPWMYAGIGFSMLVRVGAIPTIGHFAHEPVAIAIMVAFLWWGGYKMKKPHATGHGHKKQSPLGAIIFITLVSIDASPLVYSNTSNIEVGVLANIFASILFVPLLDIADELLKKIPNLMRGLGNMLQWSAYCMAAVAILHAKWHYDVPMELDSLIPLIPVAFVVLRTRFLTSSQPAYGRLAGAGVRHSRSDD